MRPLLALLLLTLSCVAHAFDHSHAALNTLLTEHVSWNKTQTATKVDYAGLAKDRAVLKAYLGTLSAVTEDEFAAWTREQRLAFLIDAYNAHTLELILSADSLPESIKDLGGFIRGPWKQAFFSLFGDERNLDEVEHSLIRGNAEFNEPRVHFALNCAAIGCPALRPEAYRADALDAQLDEQTRRFLADRTRNRLNAEGILEVSKIFDWYGDDFGSLGFWLSRYADALGIDADTGAKLASSKVEIEFLDYDWALNSGFGDGP
jgi:hypothetical protein